MLMFSEQARLMCTMDYWVINGDWQGIRDGDKFTCEYNNYTQTITDWVEIDPNDLTQKERDKWYISTHNFTTGRQEKKKDDYDDEPPF